MKDLANTCRIAVVQAEPILFDKDACLKKAFERIGECVENQAELVVFPELFIPGYPYGMNFGFTTGARTQGGREDWKRYYDNSILADGQQMQALRRLAQKNGIYLSMGYSERDPQNGTLYNSNMLIAPDGSWKNHRKLKPTGSERMIWGDANRDYFPTMDTPWGTMGSLICWENYMPLARMALYEKGVSLFLAPNTNDNPEWQSTIRHIAIEGHCYVVNCDMLIRKSSYPEDLNEYPAIRQLPDMVCRGGSCIIDPYGHPVSDCLWEDEGIIYATLDMQMVPASRMELDVCGHYSRPDVLQFNVNEQ